MEADAWGANIAAGAAEAGGGGGVGAGAAGRQETGTGGVVTGRGGWELCVGRGEGGLAPKKFLDSAMIESVSWTLGGPYDGARARAFSTSPAGARAIVGLSSKSGSNSSPCALPSSPPTSVGRSSSSMMVGISWRQAARPSMCFSSGLSDTSSVVSSNRERRLTLTTLADDSTRSAENSSSQTLRWSTVPVSSTMSTSGLCACSCAQRVRAGSRGTTCTSSPRAMSACPTAAPRPASSSATTTRCARPLRRHLEASARWGSDRSGKGTALSWSEERLPRREVLAMPRDRSPFLASPRTAEGRSRLLSERMLDALVLVTTGGGLEEARSAAARSARRRATVASRVARAATGTSLDRMLTKRSRSSSRKAL
jgi:hypothetical protein